MSDATRTPPVRGHRELRNFTQPNVQFLWEWDVNSSSHASRGCTNKPFVPDGSLPWWESWEMSDATPLHLLYEATGSFEISNCQMYSSYGSGMCIQVLILPGSTNKPFVPDGSLLGGNHGKCQTQLVHLLYEATGSFEISNCQMYSSYGSGM